MQTVILAGGLGTRLRPIVRDVPKPMALVNNKPFLEYLIKYLSHYGFRDLILSVGYKAEIIQNYFQDGQQWGVNINYSIEDDPLGTGGAIKKAQQLIDSDNYMVVNGDTFIKIPFKKFIQQHQEQQAILSMALIKHKESSRYGRVVIDSNNNIMEFIEKGHYQGPGFINGGVYIINKKKITPFFLKDKFSLEQDVFPLLIDNKFIGMPCDSYFIDIGIPQDYQRVQLELREDSIYGI